MPYIDTGSRGTVIGDEIESKVTVVFDDAIFGTHPIPKSFLVCMTS